MTWPSSEDTSHQERQVGLSLARWSSLLLWCHGWCQCQCHWCRRRFLRSARQNNQRQQTVTSWSSTWSSVRSVWPTRFSVWLFGLKMLVTFPPDDLNIKIPDRLWRIIAVGLKVGSVFSDRYLILFFLYYFILHHGGGPVVSTVPTVLLSWDFYCFCFNTIQNKVLKEQSSQNHVLQTANTDDHHCNINMDFISDICHYILFFCVIFHSHPRRGGVIKMVNCILFFSF